jgi:hypothetical protein
MISFHEFLQRVDTTLMSSSTENQLRYGQTVMNVLYDVWPEKYKEITGGDFDCFYDTTIVKLTISKLAKEWIVCK